MIVTKNITHRYSTTGKVFSFPDIHCTTGNAVLITGPSGSGKTTLLSVVGGLLAPSEGMVIINEESLYQKTKAELDRFRGHSIGLVLQQHHFIESLSVTENLLLAQKLGGYTSDRNWVDELLEELGLGEKRNDFPAKLSVGEKQRLGIARALINCPKVILADEPTSALDDENCRRVIQLLKKEAEIKQAALLVVTHDNRLKQEFTNVVNL